MKKLFLVLFAFLIIFSVGAFAKSVSEPVTGDAEEYVKSFLTKRGISEEEVRDINKINQSKLPENVKIKKIDKNNIGIYGVNYTQQNKPGEVYVVTYSTNEFEKVQKNIVTNIQNLNFGLSGIVNESSYLESVTGVETSETKGYVMMREGSVTGISTNLDISGDGEVELKVYKNGEYTGFSNLIDSSDKTQRDFDLQSENIIKFKKGDVISVYAQVSGEVDWGNAITMVQTKG